MKGTKSGSPALHARVIFIFTTRNQYSFPETIMQREIRKYWTAEIQNRYSHIYLTVHLTHLRSSCISWELNPWSCCLASTMIYCLSQRYLYVDIVIYCKLSTILNGQSRSTREQDDWVCNHSYSHVWSRPITAIFFSLDNFAYAKYAINI